MCLVDRFVEETLEFLPYSIYSTLCESSDVSCGCYTEDRPLFFASDVKASFALRSTNLV